MPVRIHWFDADQTIVYYTFEGKWTWDELYPVYYEAIAMEKAAPHRVDVILDFLRSDGVPGGALTHLKNISDKQPENIGLSIFVTENRFLNALYSTGAKFYKNIGRYFRLAPSMDEAIRMIAQDRGVAEATIQPNPALPTR